jgi:hypothetical protein
VGTALATELRQTVVEIRGDGGIQRRGRGTKRQGQDADSKRRQEQLDAHVPDRLYPESLFLAPSHFRMLEQHVQNVFGNLQVSTVWQQTTVVNIARNPENKQITATARFEPLVDTERHQRLLATLDAELVADSGRWPWPTPRSRSSPARSDRATAPTRFPDPKPEPAKREVCSVGEDAMGSARHRASWQSRLRLGAWVRGWFAPVRRTEGTRQAAALGHRRALYEPLEDRRLLALNILIATGGATSIPPAALKAASP